MQGSALGRQGEQWRGAVVGGVEMQETGGGAGCPVLEGREAGLGRGGSGNSSVRARGRGGFLMELRQLKSRRAKILLLLQNLCPAPTCKKNIKKEKKN